jgi:NAD+ kinase
MKLQRVAIVVHEGKPKADEVLQRLRSFFDEHQVTIADTDPDLVVSLGGDGTMLRAAQRAHAADAPLLGINLGRLGYLTEVDVSDMESALDSISDGSFRIEERMMLACRAELVDGVSELVGLNEVLVERSSRRRLVRLEVTVGGEHWATFGADGILIATPTGSTAYALSAGGPIVSPRAECLVLVPVSAHMLVARPFVLAPDETVTVTVARDSDQQATLAVDGSISPDIPPGGRVEIERHPRPLRLVRVSGPEFISRLRMKLGLPG